MWSGPGRRWVVAVLAGLAVAAGSTLLVPVTYQAQVHLVVSSPDGVTDPEVLGRPILGQTVGLAPLATSVPLLLPAVRQAAPGADPAEVAGRIRVIVPPRTTTIEIRVDDRTAAGAAAVANALGGQLARVIEDAGPPPPGSRAVWPLRVTAVPAAPPAAPLWPSVPVNLTIGLLVALVVGAGPAVLRVQRAAPVADGAAPVTGDQARIAAVACLVVLVPLPLRWLVLVATPVGVLRPAHAGAAVMLLLYGFGVGRLHGAFRRNAVLLAALAGLTVSATVAAAEYGGRWPDPVQHLVYAVLGLVFGAALYTAASDARGLRILVWAAPAAVACALAGMGRNLAAAGVDPLSRLGAALSGGDPQALILGVYRVAVQDVSGRHEVMAAILLATLVTVLALPACGRRVWLVALPACAVGWAVILLSLSRSVILAAAVVLPLVAVRAWRGPSRGTWSRVRAVLLLAVLLVAAWSVVRLVLVHLVGDTRSYRARLAAFDLNPAELLRRLAVGGPDVLESTHTLPSDVLLRAGWPAGLCALLVVAVVGRHALRAAAGYLDGGARTGLVATIAVSLVLVRLLTTGDGYLHLAEWAAFGAATALVLPRAGPRAGSRAVAGAVP